MKAYPDMFSFASVFKRCPAAMTSPITWNGDAAPGGNASPGGNDLESTAGAENDKPGSIPEGTVGAEQNATAKGDRHQPNKRKGDRTPETNDVEELVENEATETIEEMPEMIEETIESENVEENVLSEDEEDDNVIPLPVLPERRSSRNRSKPGKFSVDMQVREQFNELGLSKTAAKAVGGIAGKASKPRASIAPQGVGHHIQWHPSSFKLTQSQRCEQSH